MHFLALTSFRRVCVCLSVCVWMITACSFFIRSHRLRIVMRLINGADNTKTYLEQTIRGN